MALRDDLKRFSQGNVGEKLGAAMNATASLPRYAATAAAGKVGPSVTGFMGDVARGAGAEMGEARADSSGFRSMGSPHDDEILADNKSRERARNDPASGNPVDPFIANAEREAGITGPSDGSSFIDDAAREAMRSRGPVEGFMQKSGPDSYVNGHKVTGDWGAPGSSGMPGPGGTVNTIPSEFFTQPGGKLAGDAAVGRARRDFQLRQEGNAGLASDATPEEKRAYRDNRLKMHMQNLNLSGDQSPFSLAENQMKHRMLRGELSGFRAADAAADTARSEAQQTALDREADITKTLIENQPGADMKVGGTMETIRHKMVNQGFGSLTPEENFLLTESIREQAISDLAKENYGEPVTQDQISQRMDLMLGQLKQAAQQSSERSQKSADKLASTGTDEKPPMEGAQKAPDGNWYVQQNGQWNLVEQ